MRPPSGFPGVTLRLVATICLLIGAAASADSLSVYAELTGKTILAPSTLPRLPEWSASDLPPEKTNAVAFLDSEFAKTGISVIQDGPSFVRLLPSGWSQAVVTNAPLRGAQLRASASQPLWPANAVNLTVPLDTYLEIYASVKHRTILRTALLPLPILRLRTRTALSQKELEYALETVLALNGITAVEDGHAFVQVTLTTLLSRIEAHAPAPEPGAKVFDPKKVPSVGYSAAAPARTKAERDLERWEQQLLAFLRLNKQHKSSMQHLLELYADLTNTKAEPSKQYEALPIWFHVTVPLTKKELLYAIETTFRLNFAEITRVQDRIRLETNNKPAKSASATLSDQDGAANAPPPRR